MLAAKPKIITTAGSERVAEKQEKQETISRKTEKNEGIVDNYTNKIVIRVRQLYEVRALYRTLIHVSKKEPCSNTLLIDFLTINNLSFPQFRAKFEKLSQQYPDIKKSQQNEPLQKELLLLINPYITLAEALQIAIKNPWVSYFLNQCIVVEENDISKFIAAIFNVQKQLEYLETLISSLQLQKETLEGLRQNNNDKTINHLFSLVAWQKNIEDGLLKYIQQGKKLLFKGDEITTTFGLRDYHAIYNLSYKIFGCLRYQIYTHELENVWRENQKQLEFAIYQILEKFPLDVKEAFRKNIKSCLEVFSTMIKKMVPLFLEQAKQLDEIKTEYSLVDKIYQILLLAWKDIVLIERSSLTSSGAVQFSPVFKPMRKVSIDIPPGALSSLETDAKQDAALLEAEKQQNSLLLDSNDEISTSALIAAAEELGMLDSSFEGLTEKMSRMKCSS